MTIIMILGLVISFLVLLYLVWYRSHNDNNERLFDTAIISYFFAGIFARISFMITHFGDYNSNGWSIFPFYLEENQRVWFESLPWSFFKFDDGILLVTLPLFVLISSIIYLYFIKDKNKTKNTVIVFSSFVLVFMILSLFSVFNFLGNELNLDYSELIRLSIILAMFIIGVIVFIYFSKKTEIKLNEISVQGLLLSIFMTGSYLLILNGNKAYENSFALSLVYIFISLLSFLIYLKHKKVAKQTIVRISSSDNDNREINKQESLPRKQYKTFGISYSTMESKKSYLQRLVDSVTLKYYKLIRKSGKRETNKD